MKHWLRLLLLYLVVATAAAFVWMAYDARERGLVLAFFDVGQGDAIFIQSPTGRQVLIDGGIDRDVLGELARAMPWFDRSVDVLIATHPDKDHIGGLPAVLERYDVDLIIDPGLSSNTDAYQAYADARDDEPDARYVVARRGQVIDLGGGAYLRVLYPDRDSVGTDSNDASVVVQLVHGDTEAMLTGDASIAIETLLVAVDGHGLKSDILKAGHHGSRTSTAQEFLDAVDPDHTVISAGKNNSYGHPHAEVVARLIAASTTIVSTAEHGTIVFESDGKIFQRVREP